MARKAWPDHVSLDEPSRFCWLELSVCYMTDVGGLKAESKEISHLYHGTLIYFAQTLT